MQRVRKGITKEQARQDRAAYERRRRVEGFVPLTARELRRQVRELGERLSAATVAEAEAAECRPLRLGLQQDVQVRPIERFHLKRELLECKVTR